MRDLGPDAHRHLQPLIDRGVLAWCCAIEARPGKAFFVTSQPEDIRFGGRVYQAWALGIGKQKADGDGNLSTTTLTFSNVGRWAMPHLEADLWDQGNVLLQLVDAKSPEEYGAFLRIPYRIQSASATFERVTLTLGQANFLDRGFPGRLFIRSAGYPGIVRAIA